MKNRVAFPYYGGKNTKLSWLLPLLPYDTKYIEPFAGSAAVLLNRNISPMEVLNDSDHLVMNFFQVLRDHREEFIDLLRLTPYHKSEHDLVKKDLIYDPKIGPVERARRFFVFARMSFMGQARTWAISPKQIRTGFSQVIKRYLFGIEGLLPVVERLRRVAFENRDALVIVPRYDSEDTVFYCDPPYLPETRRTHNEYRQEMDRQQHKDLLDLLLNCEGKVAISGYDNPLYNSRLDKWFKFVDEWKGLAGPRGKRQEILWTNYNPETIVEQGQTTMEEFFDSTV